MARQLLDTRPDSRPGLALAPSSVRRGRVLTPAQILDRLRTTRSPSYLAAVGSLDAGSHRSCADDVIRLKAALDAEFGEFLDELLPIGLVARCYLGRPFEVHTLDRAGGIIEHFKSGQSLPANMERARALALHAGYAFVEVYSDRLVAVGKDGRTSIVER